MSPGLERELLQHTRALRGLARALVGDDNADDLLQDTAVAALRTAPPAEELAEAGVARTWRVFHGTPSSHFVL